MSDAWIQTYSGHKFPLFTCSASDVRVTDIAHALSNVCRFGGHCEQFYSVAQHSVLVSQLVPACDALWGLLHDAAEAYIGDMVHPLKEHMEVFSAVERRVMRAVRERFMLLDEQPSCVDVADEVALATERRDLLAECAHAWRLRYEARGPRIAPLLPADAKALFLARYRQLVPLVPGNLYRVPTGEHLEFSRMGATGVAVFRAADTQSSIAVAIDQVD